MGEEERKITELLKELSCNREQLHEMLKDVSEFRSGLDKILPSSFDYRKKHLLYERVKNSVVVVKSELSIRKQIDDSIKLEVDIRKKTSEEESGERVDRVKIIAHAVEELKKLKDEEFKLELESTDT